MLRRRSRSAAARGGRTLLAIQSNTGALWRIDARSGRAVRVDVGNTDLTNGDGILLAGRTLYVVRNRNNRIVVLRMSRDLRRGAARRTIANPQLDVPTTLARIGRRLFAVNARFGTDAPQTADYWVTRRWTSGAASPSFSPPGTGNRDAERPPRPGVPNDPEARRVSSQRTGGPGPAPERTHPTREDEPRFTREPGPETRRDAGREPAGRAPEPDDLKGPRRRAFVAAGMGWALDGFDWTMYAFALTAITASLGVSVGDASFVVTSALIASAVGGVLGGVLADRFGRVRVLTWVILAYSVFTALTATSQNLTQLFLWRTLHGFAFGAEWAVGAALLAEYAVPAHRGRMMGWLQSMYAVGWAFSTAAYLLSFSLLNDDVAWRVLFLAGIIPALAAFVIRRRTRDRVTGPTGRAKISLPLLFARGQRRTTIVATLLGVGDQGIYYSVFIFLPLFLKQERGLSVIGTATYTWIAIIGSFIGYVSAGYIHDALGRRPGFSLFFVGSAASIALFVLAPVDSTSLGLVVTFFLGFFASGQAAGMGAYLAELFPTEMRGAGQGFAYNVGRGLAAGAPGAVGAAAAAIGLGPAILVVGAIASALALTSVWLLPETRGREIVEREPQRERELTALA